MSVLPEEGRSLATALSGDRRRFDALSAMGLPRYILLPGDPDRVDVIAAQWSEVQVRDLPRGFRAITGTYHGVRLAAVSTGIGSPSFEMIFTDLVRLGADTFIRVGTSGALHDTIALNSLVINDAAVRLDGCSHMYVRPEFPAAASYELVMALSDAACLLGADHRIGTGVTTCSFFAGQGRPALANYTSPEGERIFDEMRRAGALNFEMENATLFTLARLQGLRGASVCSIIANRISGGWGDDGGIALACQTAAEALVRISCWDAAVKREGAPRITSRIIAACEASGTLRG